jgi:hypothetical protein
MVTHFWDTSEVYGMIWSLSQRAHGSLRRMVLAIAPRPNAGKYASAFVALALSRVIGDNSCRHEKPISPRVPG